MEHHYKLEKHNSGMHYIMLDDASLAEFTQNNNKRIICKLNNQLEVHCAIMPKKEGGFFINIGAGIRKKLGIEAGSIVSATFLPDNSKYQFELPEEFAEVLEQDLEALEVFEKLTDGNKRSIIYLVTQVKSSERRIDRSIKIAENLKNGITNARKILLM